MANAELKLLLEEMLTPLGPVMVKRMFGGFGVFLDGLMFGLVTDDQLYLKTGEGGRSMFEAEGLGPFTYTKKGGPAVLTSYYRAPERLLDDQDEMLEWARAAHRAAVDAHRAKQAKTSRKSTRKPIPPRGKG